MYYNSQNKNSKIEYTYNIQAKKKSNKIPTNKIKILNIDANIGM